VVGSRQTFVHPRCTEPLNMPLCREPSSRQICLFAESLALGKSSYLPRAWWSTLGKPIFFLKPPRPQIFFFTILCRRSLSAKKFFADGRSRQRSPSHRYLPSGRYYCAPVCRELLLPRAFTLLSVNVLPKGALGKESFAGRCFADGSLPRAALGK